MKVAMGYPMTAEEAYRLGLVQRLVPHSELAVQTAAIAERLAGLPPFAARLAKESMNRGLDMPNAADAVYGLVVDRGRQGKPRRLARAPASRYPRRLTGLASVPREVLEFIKEGSNA